jgi:hypothetical protein
MMQILGSLAFGAMAVVNLTLLVVFVAGVSRRTRAHR